MFPIGLQFHTFTSPKKIPMRLESSTGEDQKRRFLKIIGVDCPKQLTREKKRKLPKSKSQTQKNKK
jgi:hypothetical protein